MLGNDELQLTVVVRSWTELSVNKPIAWNCCVKPILMLGFGGNTVMDTSSGVVTVSTALFEVMPENCAEMAAEPVARVVAKPFDPAVLLTVETSVLDENQAASEVRS